MRSKLGPSRPKAAAGMDAETWAVLTDSHPPKHHNAFEALALRHDVDGRFSQAWARHGRTVLDRWIGERPGTRPSAWWRFSAPRDESDRSRRLPVARERLGGRGDPRHECLAWAEERHLGLPAHWVTDRHLETTWPGLRNHHHGRPAVAVDPADPPVFESQAAYLKRHGLLEEGEEKRVPPEGWEPERITLTEGSTR